MAGGDWRYRPPSFQERLRQAIDSVLAEKPTDLEAFIAGMQAAGYEVKRGRHLKFRAPDQEKFIRCDTLKGDHTDEAIRERIEGKRVVVPRRAGHAEPYSLTFSPAYRPGKGQGFERWAKVHNLKQMAQTLIYLQEQGLDQYEKLSEKASAATSRFNTLSIWIRGLETQMADNTPLQKHIVNYSKVRSV